MSENEKPIPIRPEVEATLDHNRELIDYCIHRLKKHEEKYGKPADAIAIVTSGPGGRVGHSFSLKPNDEQDMLGTCSAAAAILLERAVS